MISEKTHYKMYKAKKKWVIAGITMFSTMLSTVAVVSADNVSTVQKTGNNSTALQNNINSTQVSQAYQRYISQKNNIDQVQSGSPVTVKKTNAQVAPNTVKAEIINSRQNLQKAKEASSSYISISEKNDPKYNQQIQEYQNKNGIQQQKVKEISSSYISINEKNNPKYDQEVWKYQNKKDSLKAGAPIKPVYTQTTHPNIPVMFGQWAAITPQARDTQSNVTYGSCNELNQLDITLKNPLQGNIKNQVQFNNGGGIKSITQKGNHLNIITQSDIDFQKPMTVTVNGQQYTIDPTNGTEMPVVRSDAFDNKYQYDGKLGADYTPNGTTFRFFAPTASGVSLNLFENDTDPNAKLKSWTPMKFDPNTGVWSITVKGDLKDTAYDYNEEFANGKAYQVYDPYATACVEGGFRSVVLSPEEMGPAVTAGKVVDKDDPTDEVIGEIHVRDFTNDPSSGVDSKLRGTYLGAVQPNTTDSKGNPTGLNYLLHEGINTVQIQPMYQYDDDGNNTNKAYQYDWGYDPENYNVPEGWYSTNRDDPATRIKECKAMIQGFHNAGIRVNMDVVYNHVADHATNALAKSVPGYYFRYGSNGQLTNASACGNDVATERPMTRKYILNSVKYWHDEYGVDGFRFDLMGNLDVTTLNDIRKELPDVVMYGEGWNMGANIPDSQKADQANEKEMPTIGTFNGWGRTVLRGDDNGKPYGYVTGNQSQQTMSQLGNFIYACQNQKNTPSDAIDGGVNYDNPTQVINYAECHDNKTLFDVMKAAHPDESNDLLMRRAELANAITILNEGVPYVQVGQGFGRSKNGDPNSYRAPDSENNIHWNTQDNRVWATAYEKALIQLRNSDPAFRMTSYSDMNNNMKWVEVGSNNGVIGYELTSPTTGKKYIIGYSNNASQQDLTGIPNGNWKVLIKNCNGYLNDPQTINVTNGKTDIPSLSCLVLEQDSLKTDNNPSSDKPTGGSSVSNQQGLSYTINVTYTSSGKTVGTAKMNGQTLSKHPITLLNVATIGNFINDHVPSGYNKLSDKDAMSTVSSVKPQDENGTEVYNIEVNLTPITKPSTSGSATPVTSGTQSSSSLNKPVTKPSTSGPTIPVTSGTQSSSSLNKPVTKPSTSGSAIPVTSGTQLSSSSNESEISGVTNHEKEEIGNGDESPTGASLNDSSSSLLSNTDKVNNSRIMKNHEKEEIGNDAENPNNSVALSDNQKFQSTISHEKAKTNDKTIAFSKGSSNEEKGYYKERSTTNKNSNTQLVTTQKENKSINKLENKSMELAKSSDNNSILASSDLGSSQEQNETSKENKMPQTGDKNNSEDAEIGLAILGIIGTVGLDFYKKRYK